MSYRLCIRALSVAFAGILSGPVGCVGDLTDASELERAPPASLPSRGPVSTDPVSAPVTVLRQLDGLLAETGRQIAASTSVDHTLRVSVSDGGDFDANGQLSVVEVDDAALRVADLSVSGYRNDDRGVFRVGFQETGDLVQLADLFETHGLRLDGTEQVFARYHRPDGAELIRPVERIEFEHLPSRMVAFRLSLGRSVAAPDGASEHATALIAGSLPIACQALQGRGTDAGTETVDSRRRTNDPRFVTSFCQQAIADLHLDGLVHPVPVGTDIISDQPHPSRP